MVRIAGAREARRRRPSSPRSRAARVSPVPVIEPGGVERAEHQRDVDACAARRAGLDRRGEIELVDPGRGAPARGARVGLDHLPAPAAPGRGRGVEDLARATRSGTARAVFARRPIRDATSMRSSGAIRSARLSQSRPAIFGWSGPKKRARLVARVAEHHRDRRSTADRRRARTGGGSAISCRAPGPK